jgi:carboxymethylenebutenolidase
VCFDHDSRPPISPRPSGMRDATELILEAEDGNRFAGYLAHANEPTGAGIIVLPDRGGLDEYYPELARRFAEHGADAIAIDYYGRSAGIGDRGPEFDQIRHASATTHATLMMDVRAAAATLRAQARLTRLYVIGFCLGGRIAFLSAAEADLGLSGVIGFYGLPTGRIRNDTPAPADVASTFTCPVLGIFGGADSAIPPEAVRAFDDALAAARVRHRVIAYPGVPHSFFDRKAAEFAEASEQAWLETLAFMGITEAER